MVAEKVAVVIEGWNSPVTLAMQPVIARADILDITAVSKADPILAGTANPLAVRINSSNGQDGAVIADILANHLGAKRIGFLTQNDAYGNGAQAVDRGRAQEDRQALREGRRTRSSRSSRPTSASPGQRASRPSRMPWSPSTPPNASGMPALIQQYRQARHRGHLRRRGRHHPADGLQDRRRGDDRRGLGRHLLPRPAAVRRHQGEPRFHRRLQEGAQPDPRQGRRRSAPRR